jgi:hypothetical protein
MRCAPATGLAWLALAIGCAGSADIEDTTAGAASDHHPAPDPNGACMGQAALTVENVILAPADYAIVQRNFPIQLDPSAQAVLITPLDTRSQQEDPGGGSPIPAVDGHVDIKLDDALLDARPIRIQVCGSDDSRLVYLWTQGEGVSLRESRFRLDVGLGRFDLVGAIRAQGQLTLTTESSAQPLEAVGAPTPQASQDGALGYVSASFLVPQDTGEDIGPLKDTVFSVGVIDGLGESKRLICFSVDPTCGYDINGADCDLQAADCP